MNNIIKSGFPRTLCRLVLAILLVGMSQFEAEAISSRFKQIGHLDVRSEKIMPLMKSSVRKAAARSGSGISDTIMCNEVGEDSYTEYAGIYVAEDYAWFWNTPNNVTYEDEQTVLNYSTANTYFYFRSYNDSPVLEAIKIHLDPTKTNNASVRAAFADFESGTIYYSDTQIVADYANNIIYWKPDTKYDQDNIFFYIESGDLNVIGFDIYSEGNTPDNFLDGSNVSAVASPVFRPASCTFTTPISVEILAEEGCNVYYRTDGYGPTVDEQYKYNGPIVISATTTFKAIAADANGNTSRIVTSTYTCTRHGIGEGYNPESPGNPGSGTGEAQGKTYKLTVVTNPSGAGSAYANSYELKAGVQTRVYTYNNTGFDFLNWTIEGKEVSNSASFYYVMPEYDVTIVANYSYNPASPGNPSPEEQKVKHPVVVRAIPSGVASLSPSGAFDMEENASRQIYAYPNTGWHLTGWTINGEKLQSTTSPISITMGEKALDIVAYFSYNPSSPSNPGANYYNPTTGQVIIDDFTPGYLYDALSNLVGNDNFSNISSLIVKGEVTSNDLGNLSYFSNAGTIDISRTGGVSELPGYTFSSVGASSIVLPSTISSLGNYVFRYCENLASLTVYAQVPPACNSYTFSSFTNKANCTVYVPASAIELYSIADYWKDFTILPITNDAHVLQVNLPADASDGRYKHNSLEIVNINSGVRQKYVISDRMLYTFNGLQKDEQYNIYMYSQAGLEIGRIENVVIPDQDIEVTFDNLKSLHTVFAKVLVSDGSDVTSEVSVEWLKPLADGTTTYLRKEVSLGEIPDGQQLICRVTLDNKLGLVYGNPEDVEFTVGAESNTCTVKLVPFRSIELTGAVVDGDGAALSAASVSVNQTLNGKYSKTYTTRTDRKGQWNLSVLDAPETRLTYAATECVNVNDTIGAFAADVNTLDLGKTTLKSIVGARVTYGFTYHAAGVEEVEDYYSNYQNVAVSVFNVTQNRAHNEVSLQYPILAILDENINVGDELKLIAVSKTGAFNPIEKTVTVGENQRAEVTFDIVGKGGISATFEMTDNPAVTAMLYGPNGELLKKITYTEAKAIFTELEDGDYTLVTMGQSDLMNSIMRLSNYDEIGLTEGKDYVKNAVTVESGKFAEIKNSEIPAFDESLFYYTNSSTGFSANKSSITTGNYLTLRSAIDFKGVYKNDISNVALVVDLPEACDFVEQSVIQGPNLLPYTLDNNRLTVHLGNNYQSQTRFCVIPTAGGSFNASASIVFDYNGKTLTQPIGSAASEIKDIEITVPSVIAGNTFKVSGIALGYSKVNIYEDGTLLGSGKANAAGAWNVECALSNPYNLSKHSIYAVITTPAENTLTSETKNLTYDMNALQVSKVTMYHWNPELNGWKGRMETSVFDFLNPKTSATQWTVYYPKKVFTYTIEFTANDPERISNVVLYVHTADGKIVPVNASFDKNKGMWYAEIDMGTSSNGYYPVNCSVDFDFNAEYILDRDLIESNFDHVNKLVSDATQERNRLFSDIFTEINTDSLFADIDNYLSSESVNLDELKTLLNKIHVISDNFAPEDISLNELETRVNETESKYIQLVQNNSNEFVELLDNLYADINLNSLDSFSDSITINNRIKHISISDCSAVIVDSLSNQGYFNYSLTDGSKIYFKYSNDLFDVIDLTKNKRYKVELSEITKQFIARKVNEEFFGYVNCGQKIVTTIQDILSISNNLDDDRTKWMSIVRGLGDILQLTQCYYEGFRSALEYNFNESVKGLEKQWKSLIKDSENDLDNLTSKLSAQEDEFSNLSRRQHQLIDLREEITNSTELTEAQKNAQLADIEKELDDVVNRKMKLYDDKVRTNGLLKKAKRTHANLQKGLKSINEMKDQFSKLLDKIPPRLTKGIVMPKWLRVSGKLAGEFGIMLQVASMYLDVVEMIDEELEWIDLADAINRKLPCEGNPEKASDLQDKIYNDLIGNFKNNLLILSGEIGAIGFSALGGIPVYSPSWWAESIISIACEWGKMFNTNASLELRGDYWMGIMRLNCNKDCGQPGMPPCPNSTPNGGSNKPGGGANQSGSTSDDVQIDPSGFVYEAVPENRIEGVQASIYYKETKEDMYGDPYEEIVLWNAEEYAQKNPLFTDENGMYRWDVPQGLWQVKFEKDGYMTAYSEWLPVPPPQLEVNIGIVQNKQPEVTEARAYEEGVEVQFDKFMDQSTLTTDNIYVTANGEKLNGEIRLIDSALTDEYASEDDADATRYASRIRFVPEEKLSATTGEIRVTVSRNVLSYAGIPMTETFSQVLDVEKEVQIVYADDVKVLYGSETEVTVYALPYEAAVGRTLHIANSSALIASIDVTEAILDEEGKAVVKVKGDLPGRAQLTFTIDDVTATGECAVDVVTEIITAEAPKSSRASGTAVYRGTKIELTSESKNATIYFTTDGSCPCDENGTRRKYTVPLIINEDTKILAMTSVGTGDDDVSETVEFNYTLKRSDMDFAMEEGWTWISHNFDSPMAAETLAADENVHRIMSQTQEVIRDPQFGMVGTLTELSASESYKVETSAATARQRMSEIAWNPAAPIALNSGWNWLGYPVSQTMSVDEAFATTEAETLDIIVGQNGFAQFDGEKWVGTLETMSPGMGYMYQSQSAKNVVYNTTIVSTASAKYVPGISGKSPLVLDIHKYGMIMPVVATLTNTDGSQLDNEDYQVAAFSGTECRGIGRVVNGLVMMNVYGNVNDNITVQVTDADGEISFSNNASLKFSETVVGDIFNPYAITINNLSGINEVKYDGNIKVTVEGGMLRIKGIAASDVDLVEIYDINGQKLIRETNVSESGIRISTLTSGVYVVIVNGNGEYSYHKITIR